MHISTIPNEGQIALFYVPGRSIKRLSENAFFLLLKKFSDMLQNTFDKIVYKKFPMAMNAKDTSIHFLGMLKQKHRFDISRMLMATSLCPDEVNNPDTSFFNVLIGPFIMGGLGGIPFAGITGMTAFAHHIPDGGSAFIFYGPHIGITVDGSLGEVWRPGQQKAGKSCGALMNALAGLKNTDYMPRPSENDFQQYFLEKSLVPERDKILSAVEPEWEITEQTYQIINKMIHENIEITKKEFHVKRIALLGGIIINTDSGLVDYFVPKNFEVVVMN
jgi:hypothetical protein